MGTLVRALSGGDHARCMLIGLLVVFLHGGPGGGFDAKDRSFFDPTKYKVRPSMALPLGSTLTITNGFLDRSV